MISSASSRVSTLLLTVSLAVGVPWLVASADSPGFRFSLQTRVGTDAASDVSRVVTTAESWDPGRTAIIVCDMWDLHHCSNAVKREAEFAPRMNLLLEAARARGAFIVHAPSNCMKFYEGHPARLRAQNAPKAANLPPDIGEWCRALPAEGAVQYPLDDTPDESDDDPAEHLRWAAELTSRGLNPKKPWTRQIDVLKIYEQDAISDSGVEVWNLLEARGITAVILMGVHVNKCVTGRPFGMRQMAKNGKRVVLMRDLTDAMYNPKCRPYVDHYRGTELFLEHVERFIGPTITSDQILGGARFTFNGDPRLAASRNR